MEGQEGLNDTGAIMVGIFSGVAFWWSKRKVFSVSKLGRVNVRDLVSFKD